MSDTNARELGEISIRLKHNEEQLSLLRAQVGLMGEKAAKTDLLVVEIAAAVKELNAALKPTISAVEKLQAVANRAIGGGAVLGAFSGGLIAYVFSWLKGPHA